MELDTTRWIYRHRPPGIPTDVKIKIVEALTDGDWIHLFGSKISEWRQTGPELRLDVSSLSRHTKMFVDGIYVMRLQNSDLYLRTGEFAGMRAEVLLITDMKELTEVRSLNKEEICLMKLEEMVMNLQEFFNKEREKK